MKSIRNPARILFVFLLALLLSGCSSDLSTQPGSGSDFAVISFDESKIRSSDSSVVVAGNTATIVKAGTYVLCGQSRNAMLLVDAPIADHVTLLLDGLTLQSTNDAPLSILSACEVTVTLKEDTVNSLSNGGVFAFADETDRDAVLFSAGALTLNGSGQLQIISPDGHGIVSTSTLTVTDGVYALQCKGHGLSAQEDLSLHGGTVSITAGKKGIKTSGELVITGGNLDIDAKDDALHTNASMQINGGTFSLSTDDDALHADQAITFSSGLLHIAQSYEGLEAPRIEITGGEISLFAHNDGLNAAGDAQDCSLHISGGTLNIHAMGDGIDANGSLWISGGSLSLSGPDHGDTAILDYDTTGTIVGGTLCATGANRMVRSLQDDSTQGVVCLAVGAQRADSPVTLLDGSGHVLLTHVPAFDFSLVIFSDAAIVSGENYTLVINEDRFPCTAQ